MSSESKADKTNIPIGKQGEEIARNYLIEKGYAIVEMNYRFGRGEIDIIAEKDGMLVFVEVKTKKFGDFGDPVGWVPRSKQRQIGTIARGYLYEKEISDRDCRFDVIALNWEKGDWQINHIENAFWL